VSNFHVVAREIGAAIADRRLTHRSDGGKTSGAVSFTSHQPLTRML